MKKILLLLVIPVASAMAQNTAAPVPPQGGPNVAPPFPGQPGPAPLPPTGFVPGQPGPAPLPAAAPVPGQPGPAPLPAAAPVPGQPGPAPVPHAGPHHPQPGQPGPAPFPHAGPQHPQPGQPGPGAFHPGQHQPGGPDAHHEDEEGDEHVGFVIGIDKENELVRIQTKTGPVTLKVTEHSDLLFPGLHEGPAFELDSDKFEGQVKGKMVRIASREGQVDHIEPIRP